MLKKAYSKTRSVCKVTFTLPVEAAPDAEKVSLLGDFNDWNAQEGPAMKRSKGHYEATLELPAGRSYEFRYLIDGKRWENDWDADGYTPSPFGGITNSVLVLEASNEEKPVKPAAAKKTAVKPALKTGPVTSSAKKAAAQTKAVVSPPKTGPVKTDKPANETETPKELAKSTAEGEPKTVAKPASKATPKAPAKAAAKTAKSAPKSGKK